MKRWPLQPVSLRSRLLIGVSAMLLPLITLAGGAIFIFQSTLRTFDSAEDYTRLQAFPLSELERSLVRLALLTAKIEDKNLASTAENLDYFTKKINGNFEDLARKNNKSPNEKELSLLIQAARKEWDQYYKNHQDISKNEAAAAREKEFALKKADLIKELETVIVTVNTLKYRWEIWQYDDSRRRAQRSNDQGLVILCIIGMLAITLAVASGWILSRIILHPLNVLENAVLRFGEGDLSHRVSLDTKDEFAQLAEVFNLMAARLEKNQTQLLSQATLDGLTGVYNRREFDRFFQEEIHASHQSRRPVSLVMIDIDHFKKLNDNYGHQAGDSALQSVAQVLKKNVRPGDIVARYGGEEFALVLPNADQHDAIMIAERIRTALANTEIPIAEGKVLSVTASLGSATFPTDASSEEALLSTADQALYTAKRSGRNRVCQAHQAAA